MMLTVRSGNLVQGEKVAAFEAALSEYLDIPEAVVVSSGTAALYLSLIAHNIGQGDEVIVPAYSFPAVANVVELVGARPVFVDIRADNCCIDTALIVDKMNRKTAAIMPVHEFGHPADMEQINYLAEHRGLIVIEDAACALGTKYHSKPAGTLGDTGCFSFHPRKILTTGEGGAIVTRSSSMAARLRKLRNHGIKMVGTRAGFVFPGYNFRMTDFQAALGLEQLKQLDDTVYIFRHQADYYVSLLKNSAVECCYNEHNAEYSTYQTFLIYLPGKIQADIMKTALFDRGVETNIGAHAIPYQAYYAEKYPHLPGDYPVAHRAWRQALALPIGRHITAGDQEFVVEQLLSVLKTHGF
jgi:dTDP-4-amino-4,6-dideoxygalactose transaminase